MTEEDQFKTVITVIRNRKEDHNATVTFTVKPACNKAFGDVLQSFLNELPKEFKVKTNTADDSVTYKPVKLFVEIESFGNQKNVVQRLQHYIQIFQPNCSNIE
jgi:hypothetical protein